MSESSSNDLKNQKHKAAMQKQKAKVDAHIEAADIERGVALLLTGNGKGKSSSAFGMVMRALGYGQKVAVIQFIKGAQLSGEEIYLRDKCPEVDFYQMGTGFTWNTQDREGDIAAAEATWVYAEKALTDESIEVADGTFFDEDLQVDIRHSLSPDTNTWEQQLQGPAQIPVMYRSGTTWVKDTATDYPFKLGTIYPVYNTQSGGNWSTTEFAANGHGIMWIVATNMLESPVLSLMGQQLYTNVDNAREQTWEGMDFEGLPIVEMRVLAKIIFLTNGTSANANIEIIEISDYRRAMSDATSSASAVVSHSDLTDLSADDHPHYLLADGTRSADTLDVTGDATVGGDITITGDVVFDGATPVGGIIQFAGSSAPNSRWLICDGSTYSRTTYAALFSVIGTTYGSTTSSNFRVPNLKGRVPVGMDANDTDFDALGETGGAKTHTLTESELPAHGHTFTSGNSNQDLNHRHTINHNHASVSVDIGNHSHTVTTVSDTHYHTNRIALHDYYYKAAGANAAMDGVGMYRYNTGTWGGAPGLTTTTSTVNNSSSYASVAHTIFYSQGNSAGASATTSKTTSSAGSHTVTTDLPNFTGNSGYNDLTTHTHSGTTDDTGGGDPHNNLQPYIVLNYIIKAA